MSRRPSRVVNYRMGKQKKDPQDTSTPINKTKLLDKMAAIDIYLLLSKKFKEGKAKRRSSLTQ